MSENFTSILYFFKSKFSRAEKYSPVNIYPPPLSFKEREGYISRDSISAESAFCSETRNQQKEKNG